MNPAGGRDHWPQCFTCSFAGGGGRAVVWWARAIRWAGSAERPVSPGDVVATVFHSLGLDPTATSRPGRSAVPAGDFGAEPIRSCFNETLFILCLLTATLTTTADELSFRHDVLPVHPRPVVTAVSRALAGKGGFRLSLNAYDPATDHYNITRELRGRRVEFNDPARSLFLIKPTAAVRHKGG